MNLKALQEKFNKRIKAKHDKRPMVAGIYIMPHDACSARHTNDKPLRYRTHRAPLVGHMQGAV